MMVRCLASHTTRSSKQVSGSSLYYLLPLCPIPLLILATVSSISAYELMSGQQRQENHMHYGTALCSYTLENCPDNNELFFTAITQINHGGPSVISDPDQRTTLAKLNLKAGNLSIESSDYTTALSLFEYGISYLGDDKWSSNYELCLDLFDAAAEAACVLHKNEAVTSYTEQLVENAKSFDDSLNCEYHVVDVVPYHL